MKNAFTAIILLAYVSSLNAQSNWIQKQNFPGDTRLLPASFTIESKGYITGGYRLSTSQPTNENWEYNAQTNQWILKDPVPGANRWGAVAFAIDGKGYVGAGNAGVPGGPAYLNDLWEYNPNTNSWVVKQNIGDHNRYQSTGFAINGKGYVALGYRSIQGERDKTVWKYNPTTNQWTKKGDVPNNMANNTIVTDVPAISFVLDNRAFLTGGAVNSQTWRYNPSNDNWVKKKNVTLNAYSGFVIGNDGYAIGERFINNQWEDVIMKYTKSSNKWEKVDDLPGQLPSQGSRMFSVTPCETKAIVGSGNGRFYEYTNIEVANTSGSSLLCNSAQTTYSLNNVPAGVNVTWSKSSNLKWIGSRFNPTVSVEYKPGQPEGDGWVRATLNSACGSVVLDKYDLWVGEPHSIDGTLNGPTEVSQGQVVFYTFSETNPQNSYSTYDWTLPYTFPPCQSSSPDCWEVLQGGDGYNFIKVKVGASNGYVQVRRTNNCGNGGAKIKYVTVSGGGGGCPQCPQPIMSPNPMATETTISYHDMLSGEQISESEFPYEASYSIQSITGEEVMRWTSSKTSQQFRTERVRKGIYLLRIDHGMKGSQVIRILKDD